MRSSTFVIARKEILDSLRDRRAVNAALLYTLMGPLIVGLLSFSTPQAGGSNPDTLSGLATVFALLAAFTGGMNIAMDSLAGERERRSLLPLLMNPVRRRDLVLSKWIAISASACLGVLANVCGLAIVFAHAGLLTKVAAGSMIEILAIGIVPLALFAAVAELFVSTLSRTLREAHTSIAFVVFLPMVLGMFLVFFPHVFGKWTLIVPILGQELLLGVSAHGGHLDVKAAWILCGLTLWLALICLRLTERLLGRDAIVYGN